MKTSKKTFELSSITKFKEQERKLRLLPLVCLMFTVFGTGKNAYDYYVQNPGAMTGFGVLTWFLLGTVLLAGIPYLILKTKIVIRRKITIQKCTIDSMQDFDYYRDKLTGVSPATISILTDLQVEPKKDVAASVLQYENLGLLAETADHIYYTTEKYKNYDALRPSDRYLIEHLVQGNFNPETDMKWKKLAMKEAFEDGYVTGAAVKLRGVHTSNKIGALVVLLYLVLVAMSLPMLLQFDKLEEDIVAWTIRYCGSLKGLLSFVGFVFLVLYTMFLIAYAVAMMSPVGDEVVKNFTHRIRRTEYGNQMAECVYGMKNFIHDYSNLSEADRRQVVLWEEYLVYAVVLEENEQIIDEIMNERKYGV